MLSMSAIESSPDPIEQEATSFDDYLAVFLRTEQMEIESAGGTLSENKVGRPSASRNSEKKRLYELLNTTENQKLLAQSIALYNELQPTHRSKISD